MEEPIPPRTAPVGMADFLALPLAWWRATAKRDRPRNIPAWTADLLLVFGALGLLFMAFSLLVHPLFLAYDSMQDYAHIWFISDQLFHHADLPLKIPSLDGGDAVTFPYGFVPYLVGAALFPILGNWTLVLMMTVVMLGTVWAAAVVRPAMRNPWLLLLFIMNPFYIDGVYAFQFPTLWSTFFFFLFVWAFEQRRYLLAGALLWLTISTHPVIGGASAGVYGLAVLLLDRPRLQPLILLSLPVALALVPIAWMTLITPSVHENSPSTVALAALRALPRRGTVIVAPFALTLTAPFILRHYRPVFALATMLLFLGLMAATSTLAPWADGTYYGVTHSSSDMYAAFFESSQFHPGAIYRVMEPNDREDGMYRFIQQGAVLATEFFTESMYRIDWTLTQYQCYVAVKAVDYVSIEAAYQTVFHTNEQSILESLVSSGRASIVYVDPAGQFKIYDVRKFAREQPAASSLDQCGIY